MSARPRSWPRRAKFGAVTVATNMAGRGTDIMLGGNAEYMAKNDLRKAGLTDELIAEATGYAETDNQEILDARKLFAEKLAQHKAEIAGEADKVRAAGGLFIIGTERHDSRRIDNQLRGRAGRQGDPGETRFYISLEDDLMRLFGGDRVTGHDGAHEHRRGHPHREQDALPRHRAGPDHGGKPQLPGP